jgi:translation initiation factor IF-3
VNFKIRVPNVRVINANGDMLGVMTTRDAQRLADQQGLDLVEVSPNAEPPVCKIMDYGKFRYEESIKRKEARKNQKTTLIKEVKFHASVDSNDLGHKLRQMKEFLDEGHKVKVTLQYRGRENAHKELGMEVVQKVIAECASFSVIEQSPRLIGRMLGCMLAPKPVKPGSGQQASRPPAQQPPRPPAQAAPQPLRPPAPPAQPTQPPAAQPPEPPDQPPQPPAPQPPAPPPPPAAPVS